MVTDPAFWVEDYAKAGADQYTFHIEATSTLFHKKPLTWFHLEEPLELIKKIKACGMKAGVAIKPKTSIADVIDLVPHVDLVLVMTVEPVRENHGDCFICRGLEAKSWCWIV